MIIVNKEIEAKLSQGKKIKINLGSGPGKKEGFYNLDILDGEYIDIIADINKPLHLLPDNSVEEIWSCHALEHIENIILLMEELHRISMPDANIKIIVPHFSNPYYYSDPTHKVFFGLFSMYYFCSKDQQPSFRQVLDFYTKKYFLINAITVHLLNHELIDRLIFPRLFNFINKSIKRLDFYERRLCRLFPASHIVYQITPQK